MPMTSHWTEITVDTWADFRAIRDRLKPRGADAARWIFRGQRHATWNIRSKYERFADHLASIRSTPLSGAKAEEYMLREFKRHFHRYASNPPEIDNTLEWLSIMQHHGAPTRLVDWTFSEFIALYFAIADASVGDTAAVFVVNQAELWRSLKKRIKPAWRRRLYQNDKDVEAINNILSLSRVRMIAPLNPMRLTQRLTVQQGTFLVAVDANDSFEESLAESIQRSRAECWKVRIECTRPFLNDALAGLDRVNISDVSLFPGVDGLARSMQGICRLEYRTPQR